VNCDQSSCKDLTANPVSDTQPEFVADSQAAWHRPLVTIIDIKRTMIEGGSAIDGGTGSVL
jgi:hypothetical protein